MGRFSDLLQAPVESAAAQSQRLGGLADVAVIARQSFLDKRIRLPPGSFHPSGRVSSVLQTKIAGAHDVFPGHQHGPLDRMVQLPDISRPTVIRKESASPVIKSRQRLSIALRVLAQKVNCQQLPYPPGGRAEEAGEFRWYSAEQQIFAKTPGGISSVQVGIGRSGSSRLACRVLEDPTRSNSPVSKHAQKLGLRVQGDVGDFIQEQCATIRKLEAAHPIHFGVRESALYMPKKFAFEYAFRKPARIHSNHWLRGAQRERNAASAQ